jgi:MinD-like ATPase involved in chromosome partitioning or flagellar assembly
MDKLTLVTVVGPEGPAEVALPNTATIGALIPQIAEICFRRAPDENDPVSWTIGPVGGPPFSAAASVAQLGVTEGDVLELREQTDPALELIGTDVGAAALPPSDAGGSAPADAPGYLVSPLDSSAPVDADAAQPPGAIAPVAPVLAEAGVAVPRAPSVLERTRAALPTRVTLPGRISAAAGALAPPPAPFAPGPAPDPATATVPRPGDLSRRHAPAVSERVRSAWRSTDYQRRLDEAIGRPRLQRCATIAVLSPKGGVGKTTITALLGTLFALDRGDRVIAVDTNPDFGTLGRTLSPEHAVFVDDILEYLEHPALTITTLDSCLGRAAHGLMVLPAPTDPERMAKLDQAAYTRVIERLKSLVGIAVLDCGTGLWDPATRAAIAAADQLVVVSDDEPATASLVIEACKLLSTAGPPLTLVVNRWRRKSRLDTEVVAAYVPSLTGLVVIPEERAAALRVAGGDFSWEDAPGIWHERVRELAALLVEGWEPLGVTGTNRVEAPAAL